MYLKKVYRKSMDGIDYKKCCKCHDFKTLNCFSKNKRAKDGLDWSCKECKNKTHKSTSRRIPNKTIDSIEYKFCNKCKSFKALKDFAKSNCKACVSKYNRERNANPKNKSIKKEYDQQYYANPKNRQHKQEYFKHRYDNEPLFKLKNNLRSLIGISLNRQGYQKQSKTHEKLGADLNAVLVHLQTSFKNNYKIEWDDKYLELLHIDHIIPIDTSTCEQDMLNLNHYSNLQYLWEKHNLGKSSKTSWLLTEEKRQEFVNYVVLFK